jgi:hypothetical protein
MSQQIINIGSAPSDGTGDQLRVSFDKCNQNFTELYTTGAGSVIEGQWNFNQTSTDTTTSPTSGRFRTNTGNFITATQLAIHEITINGIDRSNVLRNQLVGDLIQCQDPANADSWCRYRLTSTPVDNGTWFQINVALEGSGGTAPGNNREILFTFAASSGGGGGGIPDAPSDGVRYVRQNAGWVSGDAAYATPAQVALKADLASPTFTGDPKAPTPATADNDTSIATTAFVKAQGYLIGNQTVTLSGDITGSGATAIAATIANNAVINAKLADMTAPAFKGRTTAGTGDPEDLTPTQATALLNAFTSALKGLAPASGGGTTNFLRADATWAAPPGGGGTVPTYQVFTSGSGTYNTPANCKQIELTLVGGGGGGGGGASATLSTAGGNTTFGAGPLFQAGGGGGSNQTTNGAGGTASGSGTPIWSVQGAAGTGAPNSQAGNAATPGGAGGNSTRGGAGAGIYSGAGGNAAVNSGSGGGGGGGTSSAVVIGGAGGGAGATVFAVINSPAASYSYTVGAGGGGAPAGTNGYAGGNGAAGIIIVKEIY